MVTVNEPQVWTLIGVFGAALFSMIGLVSTMFLRIIRAEIGGLRGEMNARFDQLGDKVDHLDRDVQVLFRRVFPEYPDAG